MTQNTVVRFAPSPTGYLHIGNARTALFNALFALKHHGQFVLRLDDTDTVRSKEEFAEAIKQDLQWLGIGIDRLEKQSARLERYNEVAEKLKAEGRLYPCYETAEELDYKRKRQAARGQPPIYDRTGLHQSQAEREKLESEGRKPHWRFKLDGKSVIWNDLCRGDQSVDTSSQSDPVLIREDGSYLYTLPSIIDDIDFGVTHVIRGEDHVSNTGTQIEIFETLGAKPPVFGHHNLLTTADGEGLSKRKGALSLKSLRESGLEPMAAASLATLVGTSHAVQPVASLKTLAELFDLDSVSRAPAKFDPSELNTLNAKLVHDMPFKDVAERLSAFGIDADETFWDAIRGNIEKLSDALMWWQIIQGPIEPVIDEDDKDYIMTAKDNLPSDHWNEETWGIWTGILKEKTGRKGKKLFMPLRKALTGLSYGPEMPVILKRIGRQEALARLSG
jgi:glutamyl-tRNA synthetase